MTARQGRLQPSLVMLDCDGTLFDSEAANRGYYDAVLERIGRPPLDAAQRDLAHRLAAPQLFAHLFRDDPGALNEALLAARDLDYTPFLDAIRPMEELYETLGWLHERFRTACLGRWG